MSEGFGDARSRGAPRRDPSGVFDASAVWVLFEGKLDRVMKVWELTKTTLPLQVSGLSEALENGDARAAERVAHALAGSGAIFGAHQLVTAARAIEREAKRGQVSGDMGQRNRRRCGSVSGRIRPVARPDHLFTPSTLAPGAQPHD